MHNNNVSKMGKNLFAILILSITFLIAAAEFEKPKYRDPWPRRRLYILEMNYEKLPVVTVNEEEGYKNYSTELLWEKRICYDIVFNSNASKYAAIFDEFKYKKLFYVEPEAQRLQEFSFSWGFMDESPRMTRDGKEIFFVSDRFGNKEIYKANFDDLMNVRYYLVDFVVDNLDDNFNISIDGSGKLLAYQSKKENGPALIYVKNLETGEEVVPSMVSEESITPVLSADGKFLIYGVERSKAKEIMSVDLKEQIKVMVTSEAYPGSKSGINGDGNRVVFVSTKKNDTQDIYMLDKKEQRLYNMTDDNKSHDFFPTISDDGTVLAFQADGMWDRKSVKVLDMNTKTTYRIWDRSLNQTEPRISPDGNTLIYLRNGVLHKIDLNALREKVAAKTKQDPK